MKTWTQIALAAAIVVVGFAWMLHSRSDPDTPLAAATVAQQLARDNPNAHIKLKYTELEAPNAERRATDTAVGTSNKTFGRLMSWFGLGANEAVVQDKGIVSNGTSLGRSEGYGVLERFWVWCKDVAWFGAFGLLILFGLTFVPAAAPIAGSILRGLASIVPVLGSIVERVFASVTVKKPAQQIIKGGQVFKDRIKAEVFVMDTVKNTQLQHRILELFRSAQDGTQDTRAKALVAESK